MTALRRCALTALLVAITAGRAAAQEPSLAIVLERAAAYVAGFHRQLASIVAEERYVQDWKEVAGGRWKQDLMLDHRELQSDLLLVKPGAGAPWMQFRDVFEVDGTPVRERTERLEQLFLTPAPSAAAQVSKILIESARYNIGDADRNVNTPTFVLQYLDAANQHRFHFTRTNDRKPKAVPQGPSSTDGVFRVSTEIWTIAYDEQSADTIIKSAGRKDLRSSGRFWIDPATGQVLMSELICNDRTVHAVIDVSYQSEPLLGFLVPVEMRERYDVKMTGRQVDGHAVYGKFRQFQVNVDETFLFPVKK